MLKLDLMKKCSKCKKSKSIDDFYKSMRDKSGKRSECKECTNEYAKDYHYKNTEKRKEFSRKSHLKSKYGLSLEQAEAVYARGCEICGETNRKKLCIDHDHKTGKIRGCLCQNCNKLLGFLEKEEWKIKAERYLNVEDSNEG